MYLSDKRAINLFGLSPGPALRRGKAPNLLVYRRYGCRGFRGTSYFSACRHPAGRRKSEGAGGGWGNRGRFEARMEGIRDSLAAISHGFAGILMNFRPTPPFCRGLTVPFPRIGVRGWRWGSRLCAVDILRWGWKWKYFALVLSPLFGEGVPSFRSIVF